jgi:hypothetical protein
VHHVFLEGVDFQILWISSNPTCSEIPLIVGDTGRAVNMHSTRSLVYSHTCLTTLHQAILPAFLLTFTASAECDPRHLHLRRPQQLCPAHKLHLPAYCLRL